MPVFSLELKTRFWAWRVERFIPLAMRVAKLNVIWITDLRSKN
jgi:hypothetical protein